MFENPASKLIVLLLAAVFIQSAYDKIMYWKGNLDWLKGHFAQTPIRDMVPFSLGLITVLELAGGILSLVGFFELMITREKTFGFYGAIVSSIALLFLLIGQRMAKDYDGARTIVIYFLAALWAVNLLGPGC